MSFRENFTEKFTIAERDYRLCPWVTNRERNLIPSASVLVIQGYNYTDTPRLFIQSPQGRQELKYHRPVQYHWDSDSMTYYFTLAHNICRSNDRWYLETSDNVKPVITEGYTQKLFQAIPRFTTTRYMWEIIC